MEQEMQGQGLENPIKIYARADAEGFVTRFLETAHFADEILETDIFVEEGFGDAYAYPHARAEGALVPLDFDGCHSYKIENGVCRKTTAKEKEEELARRPPAPPTPEEMQAEQNLDLDFRLCLLELGL